MTPEKERELQLRAAAQIALLGETPLSLRSLSFRHADRAIWFKAILATDATDQDKEDVTCVATEVLAAFDDGRWSWNEEIVVSDDDLRGAEFEVITYRRKE
ncbi:hypothetical protein CMV30_02965 [Nibricoccus aquaticus]|uniref:Uncharacterized protein n=1 Tax=Nibricoccus aquaticus TaxID=2576891 RepID=A0A290Q3Y7_9BACT|nr:hypothetical protein [Nibricoccus aquaticus]ATC63007.1 hypothetical protein CMV30_02965 [Nibricoccus aquaticus]